jgi:hypothetical protein
MNGPASLPDGRIRQFFDEFVEAFRTFDGSVIALRYLSPYLAFHAPGSVEVFATHADVAAYFQRIVTDYHGRGCRACRYEDVAVVPLGRDCVLATVTWELLAEDLSVVSVWRESYNLCVVDGRFRVFASTDHAA